MNNNISLKNEVIRINNLQTEYIEIHNSIKKEAESFSSLFKNLFNPIDYEDMYDRTKKLMERLDEEQKNLNNISLDRDLNPTQRKYLNQLMDFYMFLCKTVYLLKERQHKLFLKSRGKNFSFREFSEIEKEYSKMAEACRQQGEKLNGFNYIIGL
ncbi:MAG: hypothetical protein WD016_10685 [Balneolaceae bacterium]